MLDKLVADEEEILIVGGLAPFLREAGVRQAL
jgi:hypothetical protein